MSKFRWYSGSAPGAQLRYIKLVGGEKVISWRSTTLRKEHKCVNCSRKLRKGERAFKGENWGTQDQRICIDCVTRIEGRQNL